MPLEACGVLLPTPLFLTEASQVVELPNRHTSPYDSYQIDGPDVMAAISEWYEEADTDDAARIAVWHTHPSGSIGPSRGDMQKRVAGTAYLVVAIHQDGSVTPSWF